MKDDWNRSGMKRNRDEGTEEINSGKYALRRALQKTKTLQRKKCRKRRCEDCARHKALPSFSIAARLRAQNVYPQIPCPNLRIFDFHPILPSFFPIRDMHTTSKTILTRVGSNPTLVTISFAFCSSDYMEQQGRLKWVENHFLEVLNTKDCDPHFWCTTRLWRSRGPLFGASGCWLGSFMQCISHDFLACMHSLSQTSVVEHVFSNYSAQ